MHVSIVHYLLLTYYVAAGKYFGGRCAAALIHVIEYQWRGLPHFHLVVRLEDAPNYYDPIDVREFIDEHIYAEIPQRQNYQHLNDSQFALYRETVGAHMLHKCAAAVNGCKKQASDLCKQGYSRTQPEPETWLDNRGYWHYRRRTHQDMHVVVPSNDFTSMDWGGHVNVEYSGTVERVLYLFKYLVV